MRRLCFAALCLIFSFSACFAVPLTDLDHHPEAGTPKVGEESPLPIPIPEITVDEPLLPKPLPMTGPTLTLNECLHQAYFNHPNLLEKLQAAVEAEAQIRVVDASFLPSMYLQSEKTYARDPGVADLVNMQVGMSQTIFDTGQRSKRLRSAQANFRAAVRNFQAAWVQQAQQVTLAYIQALQAEYTVAIQEDNVNRTQTNLEVAEAFYRGGLKSMIDVSTARIQVSQAKVGLATAQADFEVSITNLAQTMGTDERVLHDRPLTNFLLTETKLPDRDEALSFIAENNPLLTGLAEQAEANFATAAAQRRANSPILTGNAFYGNSGLMYPQSPVWQIQFQVVFPFFEPSAGPNAEVSEAIARQLLNQKEAQELLLVQQLDTAVADIRGAKARISSASEAVRESLYNANLAYRRYRMGLSDITELINARQFVESSRTELVQSYSTLKSAEVNYIQAVGVIPLPPGIPEDSPLLQEGIQEMPARLEVQELLPERPRPPHTRVRMNEPNDP